MASAPLVIIPNFIDLTYRIPSQHNLDQNRLIPVGSKINPIYANGQQWTPAQKKRVIAITCLAIAALITLAAGIITAATGSPLTLICFIIGAVGCFLSAKTLMHIKPDLDDPRTRTAELVKIAGLPIDRIITTTATEHEVRVISDFSLLDGITGPKNPHLNDISPDARDIFYNSFACLAASFRNIKQQQQEHANRINQTFNDAIAPLDRWRNERNAEIEQIKQVGNALQQATRVTEPSRTRTASSGRALLRTPEPARGPYAAAGQEARRGNQRAVAPVKYDVAGGDARRGEARRGNHNMAAAYNVAGGDAQRDRGNGGSKAVEVAGGLANFAIQMGSQLTASQVSDTYQRTIAPMEEWKIRAMAQDSHAYEAVLRLLKLTENYQQILATFQSSNYQTQHPVLPPPTVPTASAPPAPVNAQPSYNPLATPPPPAYDGP